MALELVSVLALGMALALGLALRKVKALESELRWAKVRVSVLEMDLQKAREKQSALAREQVRRVLAKVKARESARGSVQE